MRSKVASEVISKVIQNFGHISLFPKTCYEFYARMTGRTMRVDENAVKLLFTLPNSKSFLRNCRAAKLNVLD